MKIKYLLFTLVLSVLCHNTLARNIQHNKIDYQDPSTTENVPHELRNTHTRVIKGNSIYRVPDDDWIREIYKEKNVKRNFGNNHLLDMNKLTEQRKQIDQLREIYRETDVKQNFEYNRLPDMDKFTEQMKQIDQLAADSAKYQYKYKNVRFEPEQYRYVPEFHVFL